MKLKIQPNHFKVLIPLSLLVLYLFFGLFVMRFHVEYSTRDDQFHNIYNASQMTQGNLRINRSHPVGTQTLYAMMFLFSGRDYHFEKTDLSPKLWFYQQGLTQVKILNLTLLFLAFLMFYRLLRLCCVNRFYRFAGLIQLATSPPLLLHASYAISTIPFAFFLVLAFYTYQAHDLDRHWWLIGITLGLPYYFKFNGLLILIAFFTSSAISL